MFNPNNPSPEFKSVAQMVLALQAIGTTQSLTTADKIINDVSEIMEMEEQMSHLTDLLPDLWGQLRSKEGVLITTINATVDLVVLLDPLAVEITRPKLTSGADRDVSGDSEKLIKAIEAGGKRWHLLVEGLTTARAQYGSAHGAYEAKHTAATKLGNKLEVARINLQMAVAEAKLLVQATPPDSEARQMIKRKVTRKPKPKTPPASGGTNSGSTTPTPPAPPTPPASSSN
jgi:hypothetical protein